MALGALSVKELLKAGVHFGHKVSRWNPKMAPYIFTKRNMVHLIDVRATIRGLVQAYSFLANLAARGETILFVGTKRQNKSVLEAEARRCGMPFVTERWPGGLLTNYRTVRSRLDKLLEIERWEEDGILRTFTKKEIARISRLKRKLLRNLNGIRVMDRLPACVAVVDPVREIIAVREANKVGATVIGLADTDADPEDIDIVIPCNDDSMKVVQIIFHTLADAVIEGRAANPALAPRTENTGDGKSPAPEEGKAPESPEAPSETEAGGGREG